MCLVLFKMTESCGPFPRRELINPINNYKTKNLIESKG